LNFVVDKLKKKVNPVNNYQYIKAYRGHGSKTRSFVDERRYGRATYSLSYPTFLLGKSMLSTEFEVGCVLQWVCKWWLGQKLKHG
jgi:hypothetical protein